MKVAADLLSGGESGPRSRPRRLRAVAVLPTLLTLGNMLCGFASIYFCLLGVFDFTLEGPGVAQTVLAHGLFQHFLPTFMSVAGFLVFLGMLFDALDGRLARITSSTTSFGGQLDSLADMVTFGVAPATLMIAVVTMAMRREDPWLLVTTREALMTGAIFACCCGLRLARFNVEHASTGTKPKHTSFCGLPSPGAGALVASLVVLYEHVAEVRGMVLLNLLPLATLAAGLLMVSRIRYAHMGNTYFRARQPFSHVVILVFIIALLMRWPAPTLVGGVAFYALSGPAGALVRKLRHTPVVDVAVAGGTPTEQPTVRPANDRQSA